MVTFAIFKNTVTVNIQGLDSWN